MRWRGTLVLAGCLVTMGCPTESFDDTGFGPTWFELDSLPTPVSNNAVVSVLNGDDGCTLVSALGIGAGLAQGDITTGAWALDGLDGAWRPLPDVPGEPRLAASGAAVGGRVAIYGGYSVAGFQEVSHPDLALYDLSSEAWTQAAPSPIPADDAVMVPFRDRFLIVVSGWSDGANTDAVQIYDAQSDTWTLSEPFPGAAVFGHSGALDRNQLVIFDGVADTAGFPAVHQSWRASVSWDSVSPPTLDWEELPPHPGPALYRAAAGLDGRGAIVVHGGTAEPYNYDGLAYDDGQPSAPLAAAWAWHTDGEYDEWRTTGSRASMDHRGLATCGTSMVLAGGMTEGPEVTDRVRALRVLPRRID